MFDTADKALENAAADRALIANTKIPLYVAAGVPAWIVNIPERWVEFYGSPASA